jgi:hypothetical protein
VAVVHEHEHVWRTLCRGVCAMGVRFVQPFSCNS